MWPCSQEGEQAWRIIYMLAEHLNYVYDYFHVSGTYYGNHFTLSVNQTTMLYALNAYSDIC